MIPSAAWVGGVTGGSVAKTLGALKRNSASKSVMVRFFMRFSFFW
jgi:hypothetical protein